MHVRHLVSLLAIGTTAFLGACAEDSGGADVTTATITTTAATETTVTVTASPTPTTTTTATQTTQTTQTTSLPTAGDCEGSGFQNDFTDPVVMFCDGAWARAGQAQTDHVLLFRFREGQWREHPHDGRSEITEYICYDEDRLRAVDAPEELISQVSICGSGN